MKLCNSIIFAIALLCLGAGAASAQVDDDTRLWMSATGKADLLSALRLDVAQELRIDDNFTGFEKTYTQLALRYRANKYLRLSGFYRFIVAGNPGDTDVQNRVGGDVQVGYGLGDLSLAYRLRFQRTDTNQGVRSFVRNKIEVAYNVSDRLTPFLAYEMYYSTTASEFRQLRFYGGVGYNLTRNLDIEGYYLYRYEYNVNAPERNHIIGLGVSYQFRTVEKGKKKKKGKKGKKGDDDHGQDDAGDRGGVD